jgi:hypothetical protein
MTRRRSRRRRTVRRPISRASRWNPQFGTSTIAIIVLSLGTGAFWAMGSTVGAVFCALTTVANVALHPVWKKISKPRVVATTKKVRKPSEYRYVSRRQRKRAKQAAVLKGKVRSGQIKITGDPRCGYRCRNSRVSKSLCRCSCGGRTHGELRRLVPGT